MSKVTAWKEKLPTKPKTEEGWQRLAKRLYGRELDPWEMEQLKKHYYPI